MKSRVSASNKYKKERYFDRGITCEYDNFIDFYDDMYESYVEHYKSYGDDTSIDRIDNDLGYIKGNLRWATQAEQVRNSSKIRVFYAISPDGQVYKSNNQLRFSENHGLSSKQVSCVLSGRFKTTLGWRFEYAESTSVDKSNPQIIEEIYL
jgi:hypothetical protein